MRVSRRLMASILFAPLFIAACGGTSSPSASSHSPMPSGEEAMMMQPGAENMKVNILSTPADLKGKPAVFTIVAYAIGGVATIGYLLALASGPAAVVVPLVATSPALAGLLGIMVLGERLVPLSWQVSRLRWSALSYCQPPGDSGSEPLKGLSRPFHNRLEPS